MPSTREDARRTLLDRLRGSLRPPSPTPERIDSARRAMLFCLALKYVFLGASIGALALDQSIAFTWSRLAFIAAALLLAHFVGKTARFVGSRYIGLFEVLAIAGFVADLAGCLYLNGKAKQAAAALA